MAESRNKYHERVIFPKGEQKIFLENIKIKLGLNSAELAEILRITTRSLTDWKREKFSMSLPALTKLCQIAKVSLPKNTEIREPLWYVSKGASIGGLSVYKKYGHIGGNPDYRKKKWREWWDKEGRFKKHPIINVSLPIKIPSPSLELAEFIGILLGDGGITKRQVAITLNRIDDFKFAMYVKKLARRLFGIEPSMRERENVINIVISRTELVKFLVKNGLCIGSKVKHQTHVPLWVKNSDKFIKSCLRGLFDTDGSFYIDRHSHKDKIYYNCAINFTNRSLPLLLFFKKGLEQFGFHPTRKTNFGVFLRKEDEIVRYFNVIGSSNLKHINKFRQYFSNKKMEEYRSGHNGAVSKTAVAARLT